MTTRLSLASVPGLVSLLVSGLPGVISFLGGPLSPHPCQLPRQYEGQRLDVSYFESADVFVAVDCEQGLLYRRPLKKSPGWQGGERITDMRKNRLYAFVGETCVSIDVPVEQREDFCSIPLDSRYTGNVTLGGSVRQAWEHFTQPLRYRQSTVYTLDQDGAGCLPFMTQLKRGRTTISSSFYYNVTAGLSDPTVFGADRLSSCVWSS